MYKCENCHQQIAAGIPSRLFPIDIRDKSYPRKPMPKDARGKERDRHGQTGYGYETVRELRLCPDCFSRFEQKAVTPPAKDVDTTAVERL